MRTEKEIKDRLKALEDRLKYYFCYEIATDEESRFHFLQQDGARYILQWVLEESEEE